MSTETAAPAAAEAPAALPQSASAAASKFAEKLEARGKADPKGASAVGAAPSSTKTETRSGSSKKDGASAETASGDAAGPAKEPRRPRLDPNLVKREREVTEAAKRAGDLEAKFKPLSEALAKKDLRGALSILGDDHGVTFADFVKILTEDEGSKDETPAQTAERVAREAIEKAKAEDAKKAETEASERKKAEDEKFQTQLADFRKRAQAAAERDPARWKHTCITGTGTKAWEVMDGFFAATNGGRLEDVDALDVIEESWDLVHAHFAETKQRLDIDKAIGLVTGELAKLGAEKAREKLRASRNPGTGDNGATKQTGSAEAGGRAAEPSVSNRTTSGVPGAVPRRDGEVRFDKRAVEEAAARAGIRF